MTTMTFTPILTGGLDPDYYAGQADAYDDDRAGLTPEELSVRADYITDLHPSAAYGRGYTAYVKGVQLAQDLTSGRTTEER